MDLWIRSQSKKKFIKVDNISIEQCGIDNLVCTNIMQPDGALTILGIYSTEEKALKVIDDIQQYITGYFSSNINRTYSMPKDEEVE